MLTGSVNGHSGSSVRGFFSAPGPSSSALRTAGVIGIGGGPTGGCGMGIPGIPGLYIPGT